MFGQIDDTKYLLVVCTVYLGKSGKFSWHVNSIFFKKIGHNWWYYYLWEWAIASHGRVLVPLVAHELYIMVVLLLSVYTDYLGGKLFIL